MMLHLSFGILERIEPQLRSIIPSFIFCCNLTKDFGQLTFPLHEICTSAVLLLILLFKDLAVWNDGTVGIMIIHLIYLLWFFCKVAQPGLRCSAVVCLERGSFLIIVYTLLELELRWSLWLIVWVLLMHLRHIDWIHYL